LLCPACHHESPIAAKFCSECGTRLPVACARCGSSLVVGASNGVAILDIPSETNKLVFAGRSDKTLHPVEARRAAVRLDVTAGTAEDEAENSEATSA
jgi:predicted amidophosphoribosyltransferase